VLRSTWNYYERVDAFLAWVDRVEHVLNPAAVVRDNVRKTYLRDLEARGIAIVPTAWDVKDVRALRSLGWDTIVIKPVVSAGSFSTRRFTRAEDDAAQSFLDAAGREMMIQPWMPAVDTSGERSIVWIDGAVSHAIRKNPRFANEHESVTAVDIAADERAFAERVIGEIHSKNPDLLYARIDMIRDGASLRLMELELVEPSLFLLQHPPALARFAGAILSRRC
jgi:hypothetical protein